MKRGTFFKSLAALFVAPVILADINFDKPKEIENIPSVKMGCNSLVSQLQLLTPKYYEEYVAKYGNEDYSEWLKTYGGMKEIHNDKYYWFENTGSLLKIS